MSEQMALFADDLDFVDLRRGMQRMPDGTPEDVARGKRIMAEIVADVVARPRPWGPLANYARLWFGVDEDRHDVVCSGDSPLCAMFHQAPSPDAGAFVSWIEGSAYANLAHCAWYRASFSWQVANSAERARELSEKTGFTFGLDATGAIAAPDSYRPEAPLVVGAIRRGAKIKRVEVAREPRAYWTARPPWLPKNGNDRFEHINFLGPVCAWVEYEGAPTVRAPFYGDDAADDEDAGDD